MLRVKTIVKSSEIAGVGLFADQNIKKGEIVWQYTPETCAIITQVQMDELAKSFQKSDNDIVFYYLTYCYFQRNLNGLIYCLDNSRYVNHADKPNLSSPVERSDAWQFSTALRDIDKGEELTENYNTYDTCEWLDNLCRSYGIIHYKLEEACS